MGRKTKSDSAALKRLKADLKDISLAPVYIGYFTIPGLLIMVAAGYAKLVMKDRVKITELGEAKLRALKGRAF